MSAKLETAYANKSVLVKKVISGEVVVHFKEGSTIKDIVLSHAGVIDLLSRRGVTIESLRNSNLNDLIQSKYVVII